jgi:hypothetical protein
MKFPKVLVTEGDLKTVSLHHFELLVPSALDHDPIPQIRKHKSIFGYSLDL